MVESNGDHDQMEHILFMEKLKEVKVMCQIQYTWIKKIINTLINFGISPEKIIVEEKWMDSDVI